ncbi:MAG: hypothetical protein K2X66_01035 [Cyanobacteria bacterium]|nr:hypothetical protein [Cyanobacteriota bacterium]
MLSDTTPAASLSESNTASASSLISSGDAHLQQHFVNSQSVDIHDAIKQIRQDSEFSGLNQKDPWAELQENPEFQRLLNEAKDWLKETLDALNKFFPKIKFPQIDSPGLLSDEWMGLLGNGVAILLGLVLLGLIFWLIKTLWEEYQDSRKGKGSFSSQQKSPQILSSSDHLFQKAQEYSKNSQYAQAIRCLYWAGLSLMDEGKYLPFQNWRSNQEYRGELRQQSVSFPWFNLLGFSFERLAMAFERGYYGRKVLHQEDYEVCAQAFVEMKNLEKSSQLDNTDDV